MNVKVSWTLLAAILLSVSMMASIGVVHVVHAGSSGAVVKIVNPTFSTYDSRVLMLNVTFCYGGLRYSLTYNLDGETEGSIPMGEYRPPNNEFHVVNTAFAWVELPEMSDGPHSVTVTLVAHVHYGGGGKPGAPFQPETPGSSEYVSSWTDTVRFSVSSSESYKSEPKPAVDSTPPEITDLPVNNQTYLSSDVPLNFALNENISRIAYSLDGCDNVTIAGNTTLHGIAAGTHNLTVYAWDVAGNVGTSKTINFYVVGNNDKQVSTNQLAYLGVAFSATLLIRVAASLLYLKKRRPNRAKHFL
jgi:hypothetical protein